MKKLLVIVCLLLIVFGSCITRDDVNILGVESFNIDNLSKPELTVSVENLSGYKIYLNEARFVIDNNGMEIGEVILAEPVAVARKSVTNVVIPMRMKISNPLAVMSMGFSGGLPVDSMTVTGEMTVKVGPGRKKFKVDDMPLSKFLSIFGIDKNSLDKIMM